VRMCRTLLWRPDYWIDVFRVVCDRRRQVDWFYHNLGELTSIPAVVGPSAALEGGVGYGYVEHVRRQRVGGDITFTWQTWQTRLDLTLVQNEESDVITGLAPYNPASLKIPLVLLRRHARETTFVNVFCPSMVGARARWAACWLRGDLERDGFVQLVVRNGETTDLWSIKHAAASPGVLGLTSGELGQLAPDRVFSFCLDD